MTVAILRIGPRLAISAIRIINSGPDPAPAGFRTLGVLPSEVGLVVVGPNNSV